MVLFSSIKLHKPIDNTLMNIQWEIQRFLVCISSSNTNSRAAPLGRLVNWFANSQLVVARAEKNINSSYGDSSCIFDADFRNKRDTTLFGVRFGIYKNHYFYIKIYVFLHFTLKIFVQYKEKLYQIQYKISWFTK